VSLQTDRLTAFCKFLEHGLGPTSHLSDAQIGMIVIYVDDHFVHNQKHKPQAVVRRRKKAPVVV
jgi:hypothetical protein